MSISLDMTAVLESHGIVATPGNHQCPECGSRTGLSVNFKKNIASCFACGIKFYPTEFQEFWYTKFLASLYNRFRKALDNPETNSPAVAYLRSRGLEPDDYKYEPIGMIPQGFSAEKWVRKAVELKNEENTKLQKNMDALDGRNKKGRTKIQQEIEQNNTIFAELQPQLEAANYASGWLAFFYVNHRGDFVSVNLRNHAGEGYKQIKGTRHKGIFSPVWGGTPAIVPGEVLLVERRFRDGISTGDIPPDFPVAVRAIQVTDLARGLTMRARIGTPRKTLLRGAEEAADLVLLPRLKAIGKQKL